jgi:DNA end-binding protein Ku
LFPATSEREKISFHQLNKETGNRIRYRKVDAETGDEVSQDNIIKGYEVGKREYIELDPEELEAVAIHSKHTLEIEEFVPKKDIDELYLRDRTVRSASRRLPSSVMQSAKKAWLRLGR